MSYLKSSKVGIEVTTLYKDKRGRKIVSQLLELGLTNLSRKMFDEFDKKPNPELMRKELSDIINPNLIKFTDEEILKYHEESKNNGGYYQVIAGNFSNNMTQKLKDYSNKYKLDLSGEYLYSKSGRKYTENKILVGDMYLMKLFQLPEKGAKVTSDMMRGKRPVLGANFRSTGQVINEMEFWSYSSNDLNELLDYHHNKTKIQSSSKLLMELLRLGLDYDGNMQTSEFKIN
jgi:hypothetical protein